MVQEITPSSPTHMFLGDHIPTQYIYMALCRSAVPSKQPMADTRKYDSFDDLSVLIRNDELTSIITKHTVILVNVSMHIMDYQAKRGLLLNIGQLNKVRS